jgi:unspecific monooxygenase
MSLETPPLVFNPLDPAFRIDPYSVYARMLREAPVYPSPLGGVVLSRYTDCEGVLRNQKLWSADFRNAAETVGLGADFDAMGIERPFLFLDPPDHTRLRRLVQKAFTPRVVEELRPRVQQLVDGMLDAAEAKGSMEVIEDLAYPLPVIVISEMLGVPPEDHTQFRGWSASLAKSLDPTGPLTPGGASDLQSVLQEFDTYFRGLIAKRRTDPGDDLLTALIAAEDEGDKLTEGELLATARLILVAGHETTVNLIANGILQLLRHPDQFAMLRENPTLTASATEEVLRFDPPVQLTGRIALDDTEFDGVPVPRGHGVVCLIGAANRDPEHFERSDVFDITRNDDRHLAFGHGIHYCLGAPLARIEGQIALSTVARRFPDLHLLSDQLEYKPNIVLRGLATLPVGF